MWVFSMTSNIRPTHHLLTYIPHPVPELTNWYSILTVHDANDEPTDPSPKQGIIVGTYTNKNDKDKEAWPPWNVHAEVGLNPATWQAKRLASSSLQVNTADKKVTTI